MAKENNVKKIVVESSHELTDVVREIHAAKEDRVVLTFTDHSDLLISPVNLKVLKEVAKKGNKLLISQIIQNPTGVRNSILAGIKVVETPSLPTEDDWTEVEKENELKSKEGRHTNPPVAEEPIKKSTFEERVDSAISKSREERYVPKKVQNDPSFISIDEDLPVHQENDIAGRDFSSIQRDVPTVDRRMKNSTPREGLFSKLKNFNFKSKKAVRIFVIALIALIVLPVAGFAVYNQMAPIAKVRIFVEAKSVDIERTFTGDPNIKEIDFDNLRIPIKTEEISESLSDTVTPTGKAYKGEKAQGSITITYWKGTSCSDATPKATLGAGHTLTTGNKSYKTTSAVEITCNSMATLNVVAADIGEEFNIAASQPFSVAGYGSSEVYGLNSAAFTGGSKQEYTVLSQQDVDSAIERISSTSIEEIKSDLRDSDTNWEIIENSIKSEVDKSSIKTDKKVGEEASVVNLDITIKGTATYYSTKNLNEGLTDLLRQEAQEKDLFKNDSGLELALGDSIEKKLTVNDAVKDKVEIKLEAKSSVRPKINKGDIESKLQGMSWKEGNEYSQSLVFSDQKTEVEFIPSGYPEFLKRFPNRRGGVLVSVVEIEIKE